MGNPFKTRNKELAAQQRAATDAARAEREAIETERRRRSALIAGGKLGSRQLLTNGDSGFLLAKKHHGG